MIYNLLNPISTHISDIQWPIWRFSTHIWECLLTQGNIGIFNAENNSVRCIMEVLFMENTLCITLKLCNMLWKKGSSNFIFHVQVYYWYMGSRGLSMSCVSIIFHYHIKLKIICLSIPVSTMTIVAWRPFSKISPIGEVLVRVWLKVLRENGKATYLCNWAIA